MVGDPKYDTNFDCHSTLAPVQKGRPLIKFKFGCSIEQPLLTNFTVYMLDISSLH